MKETTTMFLDISDNGSRNPSFDYILIPSVDRNLTSSETNLVLVLAECLQDVSLPGVISVRVL